MLIKRIGLFLYKYRYIIGFIIIALAVIFNVNGSSIGLWNEAFSLPDNHVILGTPRAIRTDEWRALTPMTVSQALKESGTNGVFSWFSRIIRGTQTDVFMIYSLPVLSPFVIFKPFLTGYLLFGASRGLAFFWAARLVFLWLSSAEFFFLVSGKKDLSALGATLIAFSPVIQWWFAVNSFAEMIIAGNYAVVALDRYFSSHKAGVRAGYAFFIAWCAGVFGLVLYPAWQVPFAYVYLIMAVWVYFKHYGNIKFKAVDALTAFCALCLLVTCMGIIAFVSRDTIETVTHTAYPGARFETGGGMLKELFYYVFDVYYPTVGYFGSQNACETAGFMSFFPMGILLSIIDIVRRFLKKEKQDGLVIGMLVLSAVFFVYCVFGFPKALAGVTFLSQSPAYRCIAVIGFIEIILIIRSLSNDYKEATIVPLRGRYVQTGLTAFFLSASAVLAGYLCTEGYLGKKRCIVMGLFLFAIFFGLMNYKKFKVVTNLLIAGLVICAGATVNPLQRGLSVIYESELSGMIQNVVRKDSDALWVVENMNNEMVNYPIMMGAPTVNSVNTYPVLERWAEIDPNLENIDVYNRYANISATIVDAGVGTGFELIAADNFNVNLTSKDLMALEIEYILTDRELEAFSDDYVTFSLVGIDKTDKRADNPDVRYRIYKAERNR